MSYSSRLATALSVPALLLFLVPDSALGQAVTHLGVTKQRHIMLELGSDNSSVCSQSRSYYRVRPNGSRDLDVFQVPTDRVLVITDVDWDTLDNPTSFVVGRTQRMSLLSLNPDGSGFRTIFRSAPLPLTSENVGGRPGGRETILSGALIGQGRVLCPNVNSSSENASSLHTVSSSRVYGYLIDRVN